MFEIARKEHAHHTGILYFAKARESVSSLDCGANRPIPVCDRRGAQRLFPLNFSRQGWVPSRVNAMCNVFQRDACFRGTAAVVEAARLVVLRNHRHWAAAARKQLCSLAETLLRIDNVAFVIEHASIAVNG